MLAAGEVAHQSWLSETGLRTPERTWAVGRGAKDEVAKAIEVLRPRHPDYDDNLLRVVFWNQHRPLVQALLDDSDRWGRVMRIAGPLVERGRLTGDEAAEHAGLPNPAEPDPGR